MKTRNSEVLASFVAYCEAHSDQRFWQALLNWSKLSWIVVGPPEPNKYVDTYYWEGRVQDEI